MKRFYFVAQAHDEYDTMDIYSGMYESYETALADVYDIKSLHRNNWSLDDDIDVNVTVKEDDIYCVN